MPYKDWITAYRNIIADAMAEVFVKDEDRERQLLTLVADLCDLYPEHYGRHLAERES